MYDLVVCAIFKNESHILDEWIQHYRQRGVDHIYLVNDFSSDNYTEILDRYTGYVTLFHNDIVTTALHRQVEIIRKYFTPLTDLSTWLTILDLDEFLYSPIDASFADILFKYRDFSQIRIDWLHFGSNGHITQPASVVEGFTRRAHAHSMNHGVKSIVKGSDAQFLDIHTCGVRGKTYYMEYTDSVELAINHYNIQSLHFFMNVKAVRGDVNNWFDIKGLRRDRELFEQYDINDVEDLRLYEQNKRAEISNDMKEKLTT